MPNAIAVLSHLVAAYVLVVTAMAAGIFVWHTRSVVSGCTASATAPLAIVACLLVRADACGLLLLALAVTCFESEFSFATYGAALLAGFAFGLLGSWLFLATGPSEAIPIAAPARVALAVIGTLVLFGAVLRGIRLATLPAR